MASARVMVDSVESAAEALVAVLEHARSSKSDYEFGPINAESVMRVGLFLDGEIEGVLDSVLDVAGAILAT